MYTFCYFISWDLSHPPAACSPEGRESGLTARLPATCPIEGQGTGWAAGGRPCPCRAAFPPPRPVLHACPPKPPGSCAPGGRSHRGLGITPIGKAASAAGLVGPFDPKDHWVRMALSLWGPASPWAPRCWGWVRPRCPSRLQMASGPGQKQGCCAIGPPPHPQLEGSREAGQLRPPCTARPLDYS